jgi:quercetin dioxygenase-like cupin family protein
MKSFIPAGLGLLLFSVLASAALAEAPAAAPATVATDYAAAVKVTRLLKTTTDAAGRPLAYPKPEDGQAEVTALMVEMPPGAQTGWHKHPIGCIGYLLEGELEVTLADGRAHKLKAGEALCEVVDLEHNGVNRGAAPAKLVMFVLGTKDGGPFTVKTAAPASLPAAKPADAKKPGE